MITVDLFESDFNKKPNHKTTVAEGIRADYQRQVFDQILDGELDAYDVMNHPQGSAQEYVAMVLQDMYDDVAREHRLHPDDNFEEILDIVVDNLEKDYGHSADQSVTEVSDDTLKSYLTKVDADSRKHKMDPTRRSAEKRSKSVAGFAKAFDKLDAKKQQGVAEGSDNVGDTVRELYQQIYDQGDDALEYLNTHAENFARYWDRFEGDIDSMIEELPPKILAKLARELQAVADQEGMTEAQSEPEQQQIDVNRRAALRREREPAGSEKIDAALAQQHAQRQEYEKTGKFWLKQKDTQQHISDAFTGKAAANSAALALLKQRPELKGNLVITAYGPDEQQNVKEEVRLPYPEGSENLGRANMELLIRAYNEPTSSRIRLNFGNKSVELDREDVAAIAEYYDDKLPSNEARWNFIRAVMNNHDNFNQVLHQIGRRSATNVRQPGLFQEADKKKDKDDLGSVTDVGLQRAISRAKADFPTAGSGIEALAKDFMRSQDQDRQDFERLQSAERKQDQLLSQISKVDREQEQEINNLETQNSAMSQRLQQLQNVNAELEKKLSAMTGRKEKRQAAKTTSPATAGSAVSVPTVVAPKPAAKPRIKKQAAPKSKPIKIKPSAAMGNIATQLAPQAQAQLPAPDQGDVLPPMFRSKPNAELQRGKDTAVDAQYREMPAAFATSENKQNKPEVDYDDPRWDAMVSRVGKLAKAGPLKTVWDPVKRVYKNVPTDTEKKPVKEQEPGNVAGFEAIKSVSEWAEKVRIMRELQKDMELMADAQAKDAVQYQLRALLAHGIQKGYIK